MAPKKANKMSLGEFMNDDQYGSWAEEMEDAPPPPSSVSSGYGNRRQGYGDGDRGYSSYGRDRAEQGGYSVRQDLPMPTKPPYTAHIGNLSFDATEGEISDFFAECQVANIRLVRDKMEDRPKGFGYVEFGTLDGLKKALDLNNAQLAGRKIRVSVADPPKERQDDRTNVDTWRRAGPLPSQEAPAPRGGRFNDNAGGPGGFERRQSGFDRERERDQGDGKVRDLGNWERRGPLPPLATPDVPEGSTPNQGSRPPRPERNNSRRVSPAVNPFDRERQPSLQGDDRPKREYQRPPAPERVLTAAERDNEWRRGAKADTPPAAPATPATPATSAPPTLSRERSTPASPTIPQTRPRLNLQKRSENPVQLAANAGTDAKASPFGAAKPIDTQAKLLEVEEKLAAAALEKKEHEEKVREEKKAAKASAAAERAEKQAERAQKVGRERGGGDGPETPTGTKNFEILRRGSGTSEADTNTAAPKLDEATKETSTPTEPETAKAQTAEEMPQDDGWSTVKRGKAVNGRA